MKFQYSASWLPLVAVAASTNPVFAQTELIAISGEVREKGTGEALPGVSGSVKGASVGIQSAGDGNFALKAKLRYPFVLVFNAIGHAPQEVTIVSASQPIAVALEAKDILTSEVVVSASRVEFTLGGNVNFNALSKNDQPDVFVTGFNTPRWAGSASFGNREIVRNLGFNVVYHWQTSLYWESPLANGPVPAYHTLDVQANLRVPTLKTTIKLGASNLTNNRYFQYAAGPTIGGLYYVALTFDNTVLH